MSLLNYENDSLKLTLGEVIQTFTESDLQKSIPVYLEDVSASTKDAMAEYQTKLEAGLYEEAASYKAAHPELDTIIFDSKKINSIWAYLSFVYLYAKNKRQQVCMSLSKPTDQEIGDFWLPYDPSSTDQNIPLYVKISDSDYKQIWIADKNKFATEYDITQIKEGTRLSNPNSIITVEGLSLYCEGINKKVQDFFQGGNDFREAIKNEFIAKEMLAPDANPVMGKTYIYNKLKAYGGSPVSYSTYTKVFEFSSISDFDYNDSSEVWSVTLELPVSCQNILYADLKLDILEKSNKYLSVATNGSFGWEKQGVEQITRTYNFNLISTYKNGKTGLRKVDYQGLGGPSTPSKAGVVDYDHEAYYTKKYSTLPTDNYTLAITSEDPDWMYIYNNKVKELRPISFTCTVNMILVSDAPVLDANYSGELYAGNNIGVL